LYKIYRRPLERTSSSTPVRADESFRVAVTAPSGLHRDQKKFRVAVETAVAAYLRDARSRELESSTLSKLEGIFRKRFLSWCTSQGYKFLDEVDLDALIAFRDTWTAGPLAKKSRSASSASFGRASVAVTLEQSDVWLTEDQGRSDANRQLPASRILKNR
jgi:hypothetical protein